MGAERESPNAETQSGVVTQDYGDEWLSKCMFHYRWADAKKASGYMPYGQMIQMTREQGDQFEKMIAERQISRIGVVGSNAVPMPAALLLREWWRRRESNPRPHGVR